jgi:hypothetical protein
MENAYSQVGLANTGNYNSNDLVYVSSNGNRGARFINVKDGVLQGAYKNVDRAIAVGARFIMDTKSHLDSTSGYNLGEMDMANYLSSKGYVRDDKTGIWSVTSTAPVETAASVKETGKYVTYKGETYIVTKMNDNGTVQIYNPLKEGPSAKLSVSPSNLKALQPKASIVSYQGDEYIVTIKNTIISLKTNKMMKWAENDGKRKAILQVANAERAKILTFENAFSEERRKEILNNFVNKHKVTEEMALKNIKDGIAREGQAAIDLINKCY